MIGDGGTDTDTYEGLSTYSCLYRRLLAIYFKNKAKNVYKTIKKTTEYIKEIWQSPNDLISFSQKWFVLKSFTSTTVL